MKKSDKEKEVKDEWIERFEKNKSAYRIQADRNFFIKFRNSPYIQKIVEYVKLRGNESVLEAGCGSDKFSVTLATFGCEVFALDCSDGMLANVELLKKEAEKYFGKLKLKTIFGDITNLPFENGTFDLVVNEGVVEHWLDKNERLHVINEMVRVTKESGYVVIFVPNGKHLLHRWWELTKYPGYVSAPPMTLYDTKKLRKELEIAGLKDIKTDGIGAWHSISQWPRFKFLSLIGSGLNRFIPLPKAVREKFGVNIAGMGKKK